VRVSGCGCFASFLGGNVQRVVVSSVGPPWASVHRVKPESNPTGSTRSAAPSHRTAPGASGSEPARLEWSGRVGSSPQSGRAMCCGCSCVCSTAAAAVGCVAGASSLAYRQPRPAHRPTATRNTHGNFSAESQGPMDNTSHSVDSTFHTKAKKKHWHLNLSLYTG